MKVTIIIPCYNCENYIMECLDSVLRAISDVDEVICVDDGSVDGTAQILRGISDPRLKVITQENMGPGAARNTGIEAATGDQILFVDSDDTISPALICAVRDYSQESLSTCQLCMKLTRNPKKLENCSAESWRKVPAQMTLSAEEVKLDLLNADYPSARQINEKGYDIYGPVVKTYCREILEQYQIRFPLGLRWGEDICFNLQYLSHIREVLFLPIKAYWYRKVPGSLMNGFHPEKYLEIQRFIQTVHGILQLSAGKENEKESEAFHFLAAKQYVYMLQYVFCNRYNPEPRAVRSQKAWALKEANPLIREGIRYCQSKNMNAAIGFIILLIRRKWFGVLDVVLRTYSAVK